MPQMAPQLQLGAQPHLGAQPQLGVQSALLPQPRVVGQPSLLPNPQLPPPLLHSPRGAAQLHNTEPPPVISGLGPSRRKSHNPNPSPAKIFVGGLPDLQTEELLAYFGTFGSVSDAVVMRGAGGKPRGFGFVTFDELEVREGVMQMEHTIKGKAVSLKPADGRS
uniref:RRM domain-containing protein n=1 Tax=Calcidiscus leptoporus TaxID=127549 RepID=A0A7S0P1B7_9EUKA|mmetsp:Transcript_43987/g.102888  ORF Transcript_43987/g.102888 Transcript_43987/m.102888 type:complete len:164 (+) Transcript_43987:3-494(+)